MIDAQAALGRLREGNARYVSGSTDAAAPDHRERREQTAREQHPFAAVLACSDSRVPVEIVFDQGIGDLFVVRVPGNVVGPSHARSMEFAASHLGVRLIVVLGHTDCGAVKGVIQHCDTADAEPSPALEYFIERIQPSVDNAIADGRDPDPDRFVEKVVRENIRRSVEVLRNDSAAIRSLVESNGLRVVGAEYSLQSGAVEFL